MEREWLMWEDEWRKRGETPPKLSLPRAGEVAGTTDHPPLLPKDSPLWDALKPIPNADKMIIQEVAPGPKLWEREPDMVTHIAGACLTIMGLFMRQRCDWCGIVLLEYDLRRVAVPIGQDPTPGSWTPGVMVRIDGALSAEHEPNMIDGVPQLPADSCCFDPKTQVK